MRRCLVVIDGGGGDGGGAAAAALCHKPRLIVEVCAVVRDGPRWMIESAAQ
jgi:hypothetical protein